MKEEIMELLSAYLDNQVSDEQRQKVESLLKTDPQVKQELEEMRTFCEQVTASKPDTVAVTGEFRQSIMNRLAEQVPVDQKSKKQDPPGGAGLGGLMKNKMLAYLLSGTVLVALLGTFAYLDKQTSNELDQVDKVKTELLRSLSDQTVELPEYKGDYKETQIEGGVRPDDIESVAKDENVLERLVGNKDLSGSVYVQGTGASMVLSELQTPNDVDLREPSNKRFNSNRLVFENQRDWTIEKIEKFNNGKQQANATGAKELIKLANKYDLNPGLLIAAMQSKPDIDILDAAPKMRLALDTNKGGTDKEKLYTVIQALDGSKDWAAKWEAFLK